MSLDLHCNGFKSSFHSHLMELSEDFNLTHFNYTDLLDTAIIVRSFVGLMAQEYISLILATPFTTLELKVL